jgi:hypothetical protein
MSGHHNAGTGVAGSLGDPPRARATQPSADTAAASVSAGAAAGAAATALSPRAMQTLTTAERLGLQAQNERWERREQQLQHGQALKQQALEQHARRRRGDHGAATAKIGQPAAAALAADEGELGQTSEEAALGPTRGRGTFSPSAFREKALEVATVQAMQTSAGALSVRADERPGRSRRRAAEWDVAGIMGRPVPPSAAGDMYRSASPLKDDDPSDNFSPPVKPQHPVAAAHAESAGGQFELLDAFGHPAASPRRSLGTLAAARLAREQREADAAGGSSDDEDGGCESTREEHRRFAASLRRQGEAADTPVRGAQREVRALAFHESMYATEDQRSRSMAAATQMAAERLDRHWSDGLSDISGSVSELETAFDLNEGEGGGDPVAAVIAMAKAEAMQAEAELVASWRKKHPPPLSRSSGTQQQQQQQRQRRHDAAGAPANLRPETPAAPSVGGNRLGVQTPAVGVSTGTKNLATFPFQGPEYTLTYRGMPRPFGEQPSYRNGRS